MHITVPSRVIQSFTVNKSGRDFVVGDIHGQFDVFQLVLNKINFDGLNDRIFSVGDLVDRGPYSGQVLEWLAKPWFNAVRGNHEQMIVEYMSGAGDMPRHIRNGGAWFYSLTQAEQFEIFTTLNELPVVIEVQLPLRKKIAVVHAEPPILESNDWSESTAALRCQRGESAQQLAVRSALYSRARIDSQDHSFILGVDSVYVGHTTVAEVLMFGNTVYIDTGCSFSDGALSVIELSRGVITSVPMQ